MNKDIKYIIKRVIIGVLIAIILFSLKSCHVKALEIGPSGYYLPDNAVFYNNVSTTNSVAVSTTFNGEDYENVDMITTVPNAQGGNGASICIATPYTLVNGYIYSISILMANNHAAPYNIVTKDNYTFVRAGYSAGDAATRLGSASITYFNSNYVPNLGYGPAYALGYMITINNGNYNYVCLPFTTNQTFDSTHALYGVLFEQVGNSNEVTQTQLNSAMSNINSSIVSVNNTISAGNAAIQADITNQSNFLQSILNGKILEVIQNQDLNTQQEIESQKVCDDPSITIDSSNYNQFSSGYLQVNGNIVESSNSNYVHTPYIPIYKEGSYSISTTMTGGSLGNYLSYCLYDKNKIKINCYNYNNISSITNIDGYIRFSGYRYSTVTFSGHVCRNGNQAIQDTQQQMVDTMQDSSTDSPNDGINAVKNGLASNGVITQLITLPVTLFQQILSSINGTCQTFSLGQLLGTDLTLPCINVSNYLGTTLWGIIDVIISGYFVWVIARKMISAFEMFSAMKDGDVLDD